MKQDFPAGKAVEPRHLQKFRVYAPHAVAQVDHHRRNGGCGHDEYTGPAVKPNHTRASTTQHTGGTDWSTWMNGAPTSPVWAQAEQQTQNGTHRNPDPKAERQAQQVVPTVGQKSGSRISHASVPATCGTGGSTRGEKQSEASCQTPSSRPTPRARRSQRAALPRIV